MRRLLSEIQRTSPPLLDTLTLSVTYPAQSSRIGRIDFPEEVLEEMASRLKVIGVHHFGDPTTWRSFMFQELTALHLSLSHTSTGLPRKQLLTILKDCPALEALYLSGCLDVADQSPRVSQEPIELPRLRSLDVADSFSMVFMFLVQDIFISNLESLCLKLRLEPHSDMPALRLLAVQTLLSSGLQKCDMPHALVVEISSTLNASIEFFTHSQSSQPNHSDHPSTHRIYMKPKGRPKIRVEFFTEIHANLPSFDILNPVFNLLDAVPQVLSRVEVLSVETFSTRISVGMVMKHFGSMRTVKCLVLTGTECSVSFVDVLGRCRTLEAQDFGPIKGGDREADTQRATNVPFFFESLEHLMFRGTDLIDNQFEPGGGQGSNGATPQLGYLLLDTLRRRRGEGWACGIRRIGLEAMFGLPEEVYDILEEIKAMGITTRTSLLVIENLVLTVREF
ncbi:hypothetical protein AAF712_006583 [Marasmius tenuissimus]|uniref:Uncharacterized protein n=1 Tax=Marasmius tenuissimus TaxID=585030 RepID=A0ABR2ZYB6_9AGAR